MGKTVRNDPDSAEACREKAKQMLGSGDPEVRDAGFSYLLRAYQADDAEAAFILGKMVYDGVIEPVEGDAEEAGLRILQEAAAKGSVQARALLNSWRRERYERERSADAKNAAPGRTTAAPSGPLTDFDGRPVRIDRRGLRTPIDAVLEYAGGTNRLTLRANISFHYPDDAVPDRSLFERAVLHGIRDWEGSYHVFGDQPLEVVLDLTAEDRLWDNVNVIPMAGGAEEEGGVRSFTFLGLRKWSASSRKLIFVRTRNGRFDDYEEIRGIVRHEFGHALGLGDLYEEPDRARAGVAKGTYADLDGYHLFDRFYDLVMCSGGPVSDNDIEMVVLAFWENKMQLYQPEGGNTEISRALGRGN